MDYEINHLNAPDSFWLLNALSELVKTDLSDAAGVLLAENGKADGTVERLQLE